MNTLIVYAGKYGFTESCARVLHKELDGTSDLMNLKDRKDADLSGYDSVIIGGAVYVGKIRKEVTEFCSKYKDQLAEKKVGLFICGMAEGDALRMELDANFPADLRQSAVARDHFGGAYVFDGMSFIDRFIVKKIAGTSSDKSDMHKDSIHTFAQAMNRV